MAQVSSIPLYWRLKRPRYNLIGTTCKTCDTKFFPPKNLCTTCRRKGKIEPFKFSGSGEILTHTTIRTAPEGFEKYTPYSVAIIKLDEGVTISGQIIGSPEIGKRVKPVFRKIHEDNSDGLINYGLKFEIVE